MDTAIETVADAFRNGGFLATLSYMLLIGSMLMTRLFYLRLLAIASGLCGVAYFWGFLGDRVASVWEMLFILAGTLQLALTTYRDRMSRFSADQMIFRTAAVPGLSPSEAQKLLRLSRIAEAGEGAELTREGEPVTMLLFILDGEVSIQSGGKEVARCGPTDFVGEISVTGGGPATATATAARGVRYIGFDAAALRHLMHRDHRIAQELDLAFRSGLREKLVRANRALAALPA